ncbi:MAG: anti-sigma factor [Pirellulaceae bacterium]
MRCDEFDRRLNQLLDRRMELAQDSRLRHHAKLCPSCAAQLASARRLLDGLDLWEVPPLAEDFALRVVSQVVPASSRVPNRTWISWVMAVAAALLLSLLPSYWFLRQATRPVATLAPAQARDSQARDSQAPAYARASTSAGDDRANGDDSAWTLYRDSLWELYPQAVRERHRQQVSEIAADLRPIATPFNAAVTAIRRTIPMGRAPEKGQPRASLAPITQSPAIS